MGLQDVLWIAKATQLPMRQQNSLTARDARSHTASLHCCRSLGRVERQQMAAKERTQRQLFHLGSLRPGQQERAPACRWRSSLRYSDRPRIASRCTRGVSRATVYSDAK